MFDQFSSLEIRRFMRERRHQISLGKGHEHQLLIRKLELTPIIEEPVHPPDIKKEVSIRQFLLTRILTNQFNIKLTLAKSSNVKKLRHPLPTSWINFIVTEGYHVDRFACQTLWKLFILRVTLRNIFLCYLLICDWVTTKRKFNHLKICKFKKEFKIYIFTPPKYGMGLADESSVNFISWVKNHYQINRIRVRHSQPGLKTEPCEGFQISYSRFPINMEPLKFQELKKTIFSSVLNLLKMRYFFDSFLIFDNFLISIIRQNSSTLNHEYFVSNSDFIYRPYWTYYAEETGSNFNFFFYSLNFRDILNEELIQLPRVGWSTCAWNRYFCWNEKHIDYLRKKVGLKGEFIKTGPMPFDGERKVFAPSPKTRISIFDVAPARSSVNASYCFPKDFYNFETIKSFYNDIFELLHSLDCEILIKPKRDRGANSHKGYNHLIETLAKDLRTDLLHKNTSPYNVIQASDVVICLPFTSVAHFATVQAKRVVFYGPTGLVKTYNSDFNEVRLLRKKDELISYLRNFIKDVH